MSRLWHLLFGKPYVYVPPRFRPPEDLEEQRLASLEMHYGDEPLYYTNPPEWPNDREV